MKKYHLLFILLAWLCDAQPVIAQKANSPNVVCPSGISVNTYSGGLYYSRNDLNIPGRGLSINLSFFYNSTNTGIDMGYGPGWSMTYSMDCKIEGNNVCIRRADGKKDVFTKSGSNYYPPTGVYDSLTEYETGKFKLRSPDGTVYFFADITHQRLTSIVDANGNTMSLSYTGSLPASITDASGRSISFTYTNGHLTQVTDANTSPARQVHYENDAVGNPVKVITCNNDTIQYTYDDIANLVRVKDELSVPVDISYCNNCQHVCSVVSPLNARYFDYDKVNLQTKDSMLVNGNWETETFRFDTLGNLVEKTTTCCGFHVTSEYDSVRNIKKHVDAMGNHTNYTHDLRGNLTQEQDPSGGTLQYTYEAGHNRILSVKDKNNQVTSFSYDANGNLIQTTKPTGVIESNTYDGYGNKISSTDGKGYVTTYAYDTYGNLVQIQFPNGTTNTYTYDNAGRRLTFTDEGGYTSSYQYDAMGRVVKAINPNGDSATYTYDRRGQLISTKDELGHIISYTYDALGRRTGISSVTGTISRTYDAAGNMLSETDKMGHTSYWAYDRNHLETAYTNALGQSRYFTYDANGNKLSEIDFAGYTTTYDYNSLNRLVKVTDPLGYSTWFTYDGNGNQLTAKDANAHITTFQYDALNRLVQVARPVGTYLYEYDANNNRTKATDPNGNITLYAYDSLNRKKTETDASGLNTQYTYDSRGNAIAITDRNGFTTQFQYDALRRLIKRTNASGESDSTGYNATGKPTYEKTTRGEVITNVYDNAGRLIQVSDATGIISKYRYDANHNLLSIVNGNNDSTTYTYDARDRRMTMTDETGQTVQYAYDANSNIIQVTDRNGHITTQTFDALYQLVKTVRPSGARDSSTYDGAGNLLVKTDDKNHSVTFAYDANNRLITATRPDGTTKHFTYDNAGNQVSRIDYAGNTTTYTYNALNRLTTINYPGTNDNSYTYNAEGKLLTAGNSDAAITFTYDSTYRVKSETLNGKTTNYTYNAANGKRYIAYPGGRGIEENYNYRNALTAIKEGGSTMAGFSYDAADRLIAKNYTNSVVSAYSYDQAGRVMTLSHKKGSDTVAIFNHTYDYEGNRMLEEKKHRTSNSQVYLYDDDDRLISYKEGVLVSNAIPSPVTQTQYNYDGPGNRTTIVKDAATTTYTTNNVDEYITITDTGMHTATYDLNGNLTNDSRHAYQYDYENRLTGVDNGTTAVYAYDALGRRVKKVTMTDTQYYYYDGLRVIEMRNNADVVQSTYVYGTWIDDIVNMQRGGTDYYFHQNAHGSVVAVTNNSGTVAERYEYDPYGSTTIYSPAYAVRTTSLIGNPYRYTGRESDDESGNYYYRARTYSPWLGRFFQRDPLEANYPGVAAYTYCLNNPVRYLDPDGRKIWIEFMGKDEKGCPKKIRVQYKDGKLYNEDGTEYKGDKDDYANKVKDDLNQLAKGDKQLKDKISDLEKSDKDHTITPPEAGNGNTNTPTSQKDDEDHKSTGSTTRYDPDNKKSPTGEERDPSDALAHELCGHGWDSDQGKTDYGSTPNGIKNYEVNAVNQENRARAANGEKKRTSYGGKEIPADKLDNTHKK